MDLHGRLQTGSQNPIFSHIESRLLFWSLNGYKWHGIRLLNNIREATSNVLWTNLSWCEQHQTHRSVLIIHSEWTALNLKIWERIWFESDSPAAWLQPKSFRMRTRNVHIAFWHCLFLFSQTQLSEKEMVRMEIQGLLDQFYTKQNQNGNNKRWNLKYIIRACFRGRLARNFMSQFLGK